MNKDEMNHDGLYLCDPEKNVKCRKTSCQELCFHTAFKEYAAESEPLWGKPVGIDRPLADEEIIPRLRSIQAQIGGSYAIDRAIELIEAVQKGKNR